MTFIKSHGGGGYELPAENISDYMQSFATGDNFLRVYMKNGDHIQINYNAHGSAATAYDNEKRLKAVLKKRDKK